MIFQLHKLEKTHYYALIFGLGFFFGFSSGMFFNNQPLFQDMISGLWYGGISAIFTIVGYEVGIKKARR